MNLLKKLLPILVSLGLLIFSLTQKCYCTTNGCGDSLAVFLVGWMGIFYGGAALTWLANPLLFTSWILTYKNSKAALPISIAAALICLSFLLFGQIIDDEGGHYKEIVDYKIGYWLWTASTVVMVIGNIILRLSSKK